MKNVINDFNPKSDDLQARIDAVNAAFQDLKNAINNYTQTNEHAERKHGVTGFLSGLVSIESVLKNIGSQVKEHRIKVAEEANENDYTR